MDFSPDIHADKNRYCVLSDSETIPSDIHRVERKLGMDMIGEFFGNFGRIRAFSYSKEPPDDLISTVVSFSSTIDCTFDLKYLEHDRC